VNPARFRIALLWCVLTGVLAATAQDRLRDFEPRTLLGAGVNLHQANVVGGTFDYERALPWFGTRLEAGASLTYRDRLSLSVTGGWGLAGYLLWPDSVCFDLYHITKRAETRLAWIGPVPTANAAKPMVAVALGYTFQQGDDLSSSEGTFDVTTTAEHLTRPYLALEFGGFVEDGRGRLEIALRYLHHMDGAKAWTSLVTSPYGEATYDATDNSLGLVARYHIGFKRRPSPMRPWIAPEQEDRTRDTLITFTTKQQRITLRLWDNAEYDGDTITVLLNEEPILVAHELTKKSKRFTVDLWQGTNTLRVVAHNEGRVPPNTASCIVRRGKGREELLIRTSDRNDQVIVVVRER
jgi:hypothetical protein